MYNTFECHFKPNQKNQRELGDPVFQGWVQSKWYYAGELMIYG